MHLAVNVSDVVYKVQFPGVSFLFAIHTSVIYFQTTVKLLLMSISDIQVCFRGVLVIYVRHKIQFNQSEAANQGKSPLHLWYGKVQDHNSLPYSKQTLKLNHSQGIANGCFNLTFSHLFSFTICSSSNVKRLVCISSTLLCSFCI